VAQGQFLDIAVRDIEISLGAFVLAKLTEVRELALVETIPGPDHNITENKTAQRLA
jgi:hypothetical protein